MRRGSRELEPRPLTSLARQDHIDHFDGVQERKEEEEEEEEVMRISPRSDSPRGQFYSSLTIILINDGSHCLYCVLSCSYCD